MNGTGRDSHTNKGKEKIGLQTKLCTTNEPSDEDILITDKKCC